MGQLRNYSLLNIDKESVILGHKEAEPNSIHKIESLELSEEEKQPRVESKIESEQIIEVVPELPEIDKDLEKQGVEVIDHNTIFTANGKKIDLPLSLDEVEKGFHKPLSSGWRWLSELTAYILAKLGIKIKKHGQKSKLVEQH